MELLEDERKNLSPLLDMIVEHIPAPAVQEGPLQMLVAAPVTSLCLAQACLDAGIPPRGGECGDRRFFSDQPPPDPFIDIMHEEPFCPVAPITTFSAPEDGLAKANATEFGLAGYVFTQNTRTAFLASEGLETGMVGVNNLVIAAAEIPFGGIKMSGFGRKGGTEGIEAYTVTKYVNILL